MNLICLVKFVPPVDRLKEQSNSASIDRTNSRLVVNPDDAAALALALKIKEIHADTVITLVTMGSLAVVPQLNDLLRLGVDRAALLSDPRLAGSDSYVTSRVLSSYARQLPFDLILTGTQAQDGDTAHVPAQVAAWLNLPQSSNVNAVDLARIAEDWIALSLASDQDVVSLEMKKPCVVSIQKEIGLKLPYVRYADLDKNVDHLLQIVNLDALGLSAEEVGLSGSLTKVSRSFVVPPDVTPERQVVFCDEKGMDAVVAYLKKHGFLQEEGA